MLAEHGVVVARRHRESNAGCRYNTIPPPRSKPVKHEWPIETKFPAKVDRRLQRSASAPAERKATTAETLARSGPIGKVGQLIEHGEMLYRSWDRKDRALSGVRVTVKQ